jgi:aromatic ring-opening dioxygenase catalytic subunit (LigB family)
MGALIGGLATSHAPQLIMPAARWAELPNRTRGPFNPKADIAAELTPEALTAKQTRCQHALNELRDALARWQPDALIVLGDDQHENVLDDNQPPFLIYMAEAVDATLHFLYLGEEAEKQMTRYRVASNLARSFVTGLMDHGFDPAWSVSTREPTGLGHAFGRALKFVMPEPRFPIVPIMVNTYYQPSPSARRCWQFGAALRAIIEQRPNNERVAILASGGLSHFLIDEAFDAALVTALASRNEAWLTSIPPTRLTSGTSEILTWLIVAGAMPVGARMIDYVPCYRNKDGVGCGMGFATWL